MVHHVLFAAAGPRLVNGVELLAKILHPELAPAGGDARGVHGDGLNLEVGRQCRAGSSKSLQAVGRCGGDGVGLRGLRGRRSRGHRALSTSFSIVI